MSQKLPVDGFKWVEEISQFNWDFMKSCNACTCVILITSWKQAFNHELAKMLLRSVKKFG